MSEPDDSLPPNIWHAIDDLAGHLALVLYGPGTARKGRVRVTIDRLRVLLARVADDEDAIVGHEARALVAELNGDVAAAVAHRTRQREQVDKLLAGGFSDVRCNSVARDRLAWHIEWLRDPSAGHPLAVKRRIVGR